MKKPKETLNGMRQGRYHFVRYSVSSKGKKKRYFVMTIFLICKHFFDKKTIIQLNGYKILTLFETLDL